MKNLHKVCDKRRIVKCTQEHQPRINGRALIKIEGDIFYFKSTADDPSQGSDEAYVATNQESGIFYFQQTT